MSNVRAQLTDALRRKDAQAVAALLATAPPFSMRDVAVQMAGMGPLGMMLTGVDLAVMTYAFQGPYEWADDLGGAAWDMCAPMLAWGGEQSAEVLQPAVRTADSRTAALARMGRWQEASECASKAIDMFDRYTPQLRALGDSLDILFGTRLKLVEALLELGRLEDADAKLQALESGDKPSPTRAMEMTRLRRRLAALLAAPTTLPSQSAAPSLGNQHNQDLRATIDALESLGGDGFGGMAALLRQRLAADAQQPASDADVFRRASGFADSLVEHFAGTPDAELFQTQRQIRQASGIFVDPVRGTDPAAIAQSRDMLLAALSWCETHGHVSDANGCRWALYLCHSRLAKHDARLDRSSEYGRAADQLIALRGSLESIRGSIRDRDRRAGVFREFPHLFPALVLSLYEASRFPELLDAIEGSKGRYLEDLLDETGAMGRSRAASAELPELLASTSAAYVSYFVDDDETFAVAVEPDGGLTAARVPVPRNVLRDAARRVDPRDWGGVDDPLAPIPPTAVDLLSPLVGWLADVLSRVEHACVSPDDVLHLVPFHYLEVGGKPLVSLVTVSRVHSAGVLAALLGRPSATPAEGITIIVPARNDAEQTREDFARLWRRTRGPALQGAAATLDAVAALPLRGVRIHFGTHGYFPREGAKVEDDNPYTGAGLLLAGVDGFPDLDEGSTRRPADMLSPAEMAARKLDLTGSIVTMQACVTGLAREGIGGDALGLELAMFRAGASTVISSQWNVSARDSAAFFEVFYDALDAGKSRAQAWRAAVHERMKVAGMGRDGMRDWGAFSLGGDWR